VQDPEDKFPEKAGPSSLFQKINGLSRSMGPPPGQARRLLETPACGAAVAFKRLRGMGKGSKEKLIFAKTPVR
jgi:hypothetical protein